jgi:DNA repair exonuclease SbcCD nuclease subunit
MDALKFIHAADLHLGRPFSGLKAVDDELGKLCCDAGYQAWDRIVGLACERRVHFVTLGGDTFDGTYPTVRSRVAFTRGIERLHDEGIPAYMVLGNHDPLSGFPERLQSLPGLHIFGPQAEGRKIEFLEITEGAVMYGASFEQAEVRENLVHGLQRDSGIGLAIGLLHANVNGLGGHKNYAPCTLEQLLGTGMDAWCLGHVHAPQVLHTDPLVLYPGTSQGAHIGESGPKGCSLITLHCRGNREHEFIPLAPVHWQAIDLDATNLADEEDLLDEVARASRELATSNDHTKAMVVRINVRGSRSREASLYDTAEVHQLVGEVLSDASPRMFLESIHDERSAGFDLNALLEEESFLGEFLRLCASTSTSAEGRGDMLNALYGELAEKLSPRYISPETDPRRFKDDSEALGHCLDEVAGRVAALFL